MSSRFVQFLVALSAVVGIAIIASLLATKDYQSDIPEYEQNESVSSEAVDYEPEVDSVDSTLRAPRSGKWKTTRAKHLEVQPRCLVCDSVENLQVHHLVPFHIDPSRENDPSNLGTFCQPHHYGVAHDPDGEGPEKPDWKKFNPNAFEDAMKLRKKNGLGPYVYGVEK